MLIKIKCSAWRASGERTDSIILFCKSAGLSLAHSADPRLPFPLKVSVFHPDPLSSHCCCCLFHPVSPVIPHSPEEPSNTISIDKKERGHRGNVPSPAGAHKHLSVDSCAGSGLSPGLFHVTRDSSVQRPTPQNLPPENRTIFSPPPSLRSTTRASCPWIDPSLGWLRVGASFPFRASPTPPTGM